MSNQYFKHVISVFLFLIFSHTQCFGSIEAVIYEHSINKRNLAENIFDSFDVFHAKGFAIKRDDANSTNYNINEITVFFDNTRLSDCKFVTTDKSALEKAFGSEKSDEFPDVFWGVSCNIPHSVSDGTYTAYINLKSKTLDKTIYKEGITYKNSKILVILCIIFLIIFYEIIIYYALNQKIVLKKIFLLALPASLLLSYIIKNIYFLYGMFFWLSIILILYSLRSSSNIHYITFNKINNKNKIFISLSAIIVIMLCVIPMGFSPHYNFKLMNNGKFVDGKEQYSVLAQSILNGNLYMDYDKIDEKLITMSNPYDPEERKKNNVTYAFDSAFYNGKYYMYFGVLPVFLVFIPYQLITGNPLSSYYATQLFTAFFIIGMFSLFYLFVKRIFNEINLSLYLSLSSIFSIISIWYASAAPSLYCTAISSGLCFEIWSIYFFVKSILTDSTQKQKFIYIFLGSLLGSLVLACRPPVFLANILLFPIVINYYSNYNWKKLPIFAFAYIIIPYLFIGTLIMIYNYLRFNNPFEFGFSYMLTDIDLHAPNYLKNRLQLINITTGIKSYFFEFNGCSDHFPYINFNGIFINFPILLFVFLIFNRKVLSFFYNKKILWFAITLIIALFFTVSIDSIALPFIRERYKMDMYYLVCIICFIVVCTIYMLADQNKRHFISVLFAYCSFFSFSYVVLMFLIPYDENISEIVPHVNEIIYNILTFGYKIL